MFPEHYDYKLEPALAFLQLQESDFEPLYDRDYPVARKETRGGHPYYFPEGWYRHALKVVDKYPGDQVWLGMNNSRDEWAVAYHGTKSDAVRGIKDKGLYVATHCERGASNYTIPFTVKDSTGKIKNYRVVFQCRVQPGKFTVHKSLVTAGMAWRVYDEKAIRPYGLLLKSS
jgi:hypothetical protein